ncbi:phenylacetate--CoA ligase family protein [Nocardiopsis mangrovi]|uniref:Phenylacetate--CoA ligase family protein n=1 Tax=Nocardiopsis mangrovi TaxID=1179818 RepID=A0ABV9DV20_9ACTN
MTETPWALARDARRALRQGPAALARRRRARLADLVAYARANSPYYRELYQGLPDHVEDPALLPATDKKALMARFDDWPTDREVTLDRVQAFVSDPLLVGARFQGRYLVATSSGTSGVRGLFLMDERHLAVHTALGARTSGGLGAADAARMLARAGRTAVVTAPGGHFSTVAATARFRLDHPWAGRILRVFSIEQPLEDLVAELNRYRPATLSGFLSMLTVLAGEQRAGRLRIRPGVVIAGGETMTGKARDELASAFGAQVRAAYASTECGFLSVGCAQCWYHLNSDWALAEPVDADHRPVAPGEPSHTVLISNLANRVQPILRYDLGDSVLVRPEPCPCGNPLPAMRVRGRAADVLTFATGGGEHVDLSPMVFGVLLDRLPGVERFQIVQTGPSELRVRLAAADGADTAGVWRTVLDALGALLAGHGAGGVTVVRAEEPPQRSSGGKFRRVLPLAAP